MAIDRLSLTFGALADPTRRAILARLAKGGASVSELAEPFEMSLPAVSKHLKVLEEAGLIHRKIEGREHRLSLESRGLNAATRWIELHRTLWEEKFDAVERHLRVQDERRN